MTIIAFTPEKIYTDKAATTSVIARTYDGKVRRLGDSVLVACAGLALTEAEMSCFTPLISQIVAVRTPHDSYDLLDELSDIFSKSNLESTLVFVTPTRFIFVQLNPFRREIDLFTRGEMGKMPMAIGSGALHFIQSLEIESTVEKAVIAATIADPHCGKGVICIDIKDLGKGDNVPAFVPRPKPAKEERPRGAIKLGNKFPFPFPPIPR